MRHRQPRRLRLVQCRLSSQCDRWVRLSDLPRSLHTPNVSGVECCLLSRRVMWRCVGTTRLIHTLIGNICSCLNGVPTVATGTGATLCATHNQQDCSACSTLLPSLFDLNLPCHFSNSCINVTSEVNSKLCGYAGTGYSLSAEAGAGAQTCAGFCAACCVLLCGCAFFLHVLRP